MAENLGKTRICKSCRKEFPETEDYFSKRSNSSGKEWWNRYCRGCYKFICQGKKPLMEKQDSVKNTKICSRCNIEKDLSEFYESQSYWCKECYKEYQKKRNKKDFKDAPENFKDAPENFKDAPEKNSAAAPENFKKSAKKINELIIEEGFNGFGGNLKAIDLYKKLAEKIFILMRINRIGKYNVDTQNIILELMNACSTHLQKELQSIKKFDGKVEKPFKIKKEVINVEWQ